MIASHAFARRAGAAPDSAGLLIALCRCWVTARRQSREPMPAMMRLVEGCGHDCMLVPICDSFFALSESCLGRALVAGPVGPGGAIAPPRPYLPDEIGLLATVVRCSRMDGARTDPAIPHGLPGALCWAARTVRRALGPLVMPDPAAAAATGTPARCPFPRQAPKPAEARVIGDFP